MVTFATFYTSFGTPWEYPGYYPLFPKTVHFFLREAKLQRSVYIGIKCSDPSSKRYAVKVMDKGYMMRKNMLSELLAEKDIMAQIDSKYIVQLYYW